MVARWLFTGLSEMSPLTPSLYHIIVDTVHMAQVTLLMYCMSKGIHSPFFSLTREIYMLIC